MSQKNALSELASICIGWTIPGHQMDRGLDLVAGKWELTRGCLWKPILKVRFLGHPVDQNFALSTKHTNAGLRPASELMQDNINHSF